MSSPAAKGFPRALVLNADYQPLSTWPPSMLDADEAVHAVLKGRVDVVETWPGLSFRSPSTEVALPKVVVLREYAPVHGRPKFCRRSIYLRDHYTCFPAGTRILLANGRQVSIEDVRAGDRVIDAYGKPVNVVRVRSRVTRDCVVIKRRGSFERTVVTTDHPFLTGDGHFKPIGEISTTALAKIGGIGDYLTFPRRVYYELPEPRAVDLTKFIADHRDWLRFRDGRVFLSRHEHANGLPVSVQQSPDLAYLLGLYVAEGSATDSGGVTFSFCNDEEHTLAADTARLLAELLGMRTWTHVNHEKHGCVVGCSSKLLAEVLQRTCGKGARNKRAPWELIGPYHAEFLRGLFLGDACIDLKRQKASLSMAGLQAVRDAESMLWGLGIIPTVQHNALPGKLPVLILVLNAENWVKFSRVVLGYHADPRRAIFGNDTHVLRRLQQRAEYPGEVVVFNLETDDSHSYIANGLAVHNCQYCGCKFCESELTFDHVMPRSRGGTTKWENILTACHDCNSRKGDRTPQEAKMPPLRWPTAPTSTELLRAGLQFLPAELKTTFADWLYWNAELDE
jgi:5-methylcytosine-specific restriction endonuclease McrA